MPAKICTFSQLNCVWLCLEFICAELKRCRNSVSLPVICFTYCQVQLQWQIPLIRGKLLPLGFTNSLFVLVLWMLLSSLFRSDRPTDQLKLFSLLKVLEYFICFLFLFFILYYLYKIIFYFYLITIFWEDMLTTVVVLFRLYNI